MGNDGKRGGAAVAERGETASATSREVPSALVDALERLIVGAVGMTALALSEAELPVDLTLPQWRVLVIVSESDGLRVGEIAGRVGVGLPSASRLIRRLEDRGLVTTERDESDRRATLVRATEQGRRVRTTLVRKRRRLIADALQATGDPLPSSSVDVLVAIAKDFARFA